MLAEKSTYRPGQSKYIKENFGLMLKGIRDIAWFWDFEAKEVSFSGKWESITGNRNLINNGTMFKFFSLVPKEDRRPLLGEIKKFLQEKSDFFIASFRIRLKDGTFSWVLCNGAAARNESGGIIKMAGSLTDISKYKALEQELQYVSNFDPDTGLPKFKYVFDRLRNTENASIRLKNKGAALFIDLDDFRKLSDTYGLRVSNALLVSVVEKLKGCIRENDNISRMDGDEFLMLLADTDSGEAAASIAKRVLRLFKQPFHISGHEIFVTASIGIIMCPGAYEDYCELVQIGNSAIYSAKKRGKNQYRFFEKAANEKLLQRYNLENDLRRAIAQNEFTLYYQPVVSAATGRLSGLEALIRWQHPRRGLVPPLDFIPVAEENGLIVSIGNWVLEAACTQNRLWQEKGYSHVSVAVNISARQLQQKDFYGIVIKALENSRLEPKYLELEITESAWMESMEAAAQTLVNLKDKGVRITLDDFGTHYSSLIYLKQLPVDKIKIDKSFITDINKNPKNEAIISALITLSCKMNISLVAEGVETGEQLDYLREQGCELLQGYLFSKPLPAASIEDYVKESRISPAKECFNYYQI